MFKKRNLAKRILNPDEIFVDSKNIPDFDKYRFEGRMEKPINKSAFIGIGIFFFAMGMIIFAKTAYLQVVEGEKYAANSKKNYLRLESILPNRGIIYDRN